MTAIGPVPTAPSGQAPHVRPAYRILGRAHASVNGLFSAVEVLDANRRESNPSTKGRMSKVEVKVVRSAIVLTSAGLDAAMKRLVNDVGRVLASTPGTGARRQFEEYLKTELAKPKAEEPFRQAILSADVSTELMSAYLAARTKASFQGSGDLKVRVRQALGIPKSEVPDADLVALDEFFTARNKISHDMDLKEPGTDSVAREHRKPDVVAAQCKAVFEVGGTLIRAAAVAYRKAGK
ncbi:hypothetical protein GCM10009713_02340 [Brevibacterium celere]